MYRRSGLLVALLVALAGVLLLLSGLGAARAQNSGFQLNRYEPTAAGESSLWVDHPWYSRTRYFAGGLAFNYGRQPLVFGYTDPDGQFVTSKRVIAQQLIAHIDLAGSFLDRVLLSLSLPVSLVESGEPDGGVAAFSGVAAGDLRFGALVRVYGQPYESRFSISAGGQIWLPLRRFNDSLPQTQSDQEFRGLPKVVLGGVVSRVLWSVSTGFLIRPEAVLGNQGSLAGSTAGSELQLGLALAYFNRELRLSVGPELVFGTALSGSAFQLSSSSLEALLGIHYNIAGLVQLSLGGGLGVLNQPGTPDSRFVLRVSYAPVPNQNLRDRDRDGVPDVYDFCPDEAKGAHPDSVQLGCPLRDQDGDGVFDERDRCAQTPQGSRPDPEKPGCPYGDRDGDGVLDPEDRCTEEPSGAHPDPGAPGCPQRDRDGDGLFDLQDQCPDASRGDHPDPAKPGCPAADRDEDGIFDPEDLCPDEPSGDRPDAARRGCPLPDRDADSVPDAADSCPDRAGAPSPFPAKNGCPGLVEIKGAELVLEKPVRFVDRTDDLDRKSIAVMQSVADALQASPQLRKVRIEARIVNRGLPEQGRERADRRARSVMQWLTQHGIDLKRLEARGVLWEPPPADSQSDAQARIDHVAFVIVDPPRPAAAQPVKPADGKTDRASKPPRPKRQKTR